MAILTTGVTATTSAASLAAFGSGGTIDDVIPVVLYNRADAVGPVYCSGSTTLGSSSSAFQIAVGASLSLRLFDGDRLFLWTGSTGGIVVDRLLGRQ